MPRREAAISKQFQRVGLTASQRSGGIEVKVMDMDIAIVVSSNMLRSEQESLSILFRPFLTILKHLTHSSITIDISIRTLEIAGVLCQ